MVKVAIQVKCGKKIFVLRAHFDFYNYNPGFVRVSGALSSSQGESRGSIKYISDNDKINLIAFHRFELLRGSSRQDQISKVLFKI